MCVECHVCGAILLRTCDPCIEDDTCCVHGEKCDICAEIEDGTLGWRPPKDFVPFKKVID